MKPYRRKINDCYDCIYFKDKCDGNNMFVATTSARGVVRCKMQKENMTAEEIDRFIEGKEI